MKTAKLHIIIYLKYWWWGGGVRGAFVLESINCSVAGNVMTHFVKSRMVHEPTTANLIFL